MSFLSERLKAGLTQEAAAAALGYKDNSSVSAWESGKWRPRTSKLVEIATLYGTTTDALLKDNPIPEN